MTELWPDIIVSSLVYLTTSLVIVNMFMALLAWLATLWPRYLWRIVMALLAYLAAHSVMSYIVMVYIAMAVFAHSTAHLRHAMRAYRHSRMSLYTYA